MSWLCNFLDHRWRHITGKVWQCDRCKECSVGRDADALPDLTGARYLAGYFHGVPDAERGG